jgi:hypothetical protein
VALARGEIVRVVSRRDLHSARACSRSADEKACTA